jgi:hypothetical protein
MMAAVLGADFEDAPTEKGEDGELELEPVMNALPEGVTTGYAAPEAPETPKAPVGNCGPNENGVDAGAAVLSPPASESLDREEVEPGLSDLTWLSL